MNIEKEKILLVTVLLDSYTSYEFIMTATGLNEKEVLYIHKNFLIEKYNEAVIDPNLYGGYFSHLIKSKQKVK